MWICYGAALPWNHVKLELRHGLPGWLAVIQAPVETSRRRLPRGVSMFAPARRSVILCCVKTPKRPATPRWKKIIFASPDWPKKLVIPQADFLPEGSECVLESMYGNEHWEWELWRQPDGQRYFLKIWPFNSGKFSDPDTPGAALTVLETLHFLMTNWMPQIVLDDFAAQAPRILKLLTDQLTPSSLN